MRAMHRLLLLSLVLFPFCVLSQDVRRSPDYTEYGHGFSLGLSHSFLELVPSTDFALEFNEVENLLSPGIQMGFSIYRSFGRNVELNFMPSMNLGRYSLLFRHQSGRISHLEADYTGLDLPVSLKMRMLTGKYGFYLLGGMNYRYDFSSKQDHQIEQTGDFLYLRRESQQFVLGFGLERYFKYYRFSPELRFSFGNDNLLIAANARHEKALDALKGRSILLAFKFE